jgi:hypothetical protein
MRLPDFAPRVSPRVGSTPGFSAPQVRPAQDATGGQLEHLGQGLQQASAGVARAGDYLVDVADSAASRERYNNFAEAALKVEQQHKLRFGKDAMEGRQAALDEIERLRAAAEDGLTDRQLRMFAERADVRQGDSIGRIHDRSDEQTVAYEVGSLKSGITGSVNDYRAAYLTAPEGAGIYREDAIDQTNRLADRLGWSPEQRQEAILGATTDMHTGVLDSLIDTGRTAEARAYLDAHGAEIAQDPKAKAEGQIRRMGVLDAGTRLMLSTPADWPIEKQRAHLDELFTKGDITAEVRANAKAQIEVRENERQERVSGQAVANMNAVESWLNDNQGKPIELLPAPMFEFLQRTGKIDDARRFAENRDATDPQTFNLVRGMTDEQLRNITPVRLEELFKFSLNKQDMNELRARHEKVLKPFEPNSLFTTNEMVENTAMQLGIMPPKGDKATAEQLKVYGQFRAEFNTQLMLWQETHKKKATDKDIQEMLDWRVVQAQSKVLVNYAGRASAREMAFMDVPEKDRAIAGVQVGQEFVTLGDIPGDVKRAYEAFFAEEGTTPTWQNIAERWVEMGKPAKVSK